MSFRPSAPLHKKLSSGSRSWLARQSRDPYVKQRNASPNAYRSRSAFKLLELDAAWGSFLSKKDVNAVVDLGAAPGGWSQVVAEKLGWVNTSSPDVLYGGSLLGGDDINTSDASGAWNAPQRRGRGVIVSVDLLPMAPIPGVHAIQMDFLSPQAGRAIEAALRTAENDNNNPAGEVDVILSDMAANVSGHKTRDVERSLDVCRSVFEFAKDRLRVRGGDGVTPAARGHRGGTLLLKHFAHPLLQDFRARFLDPNFRDVHYIKPPSSRAESSEGYWLCRGWKGLS